jgi:hypothetical protein
LKFTILLAGCLLFCNTLFSQHIDAVQLKSPAKYEPADTLKKKTSYRRNISALFLGLGGGISIPLKSFKDNSAVTFGILGRLEFSSTSIFPFVIGGEVTYFSYNGADVFKTTNLLATFKTKDLGFGLNIEYSLAKLLNSSFTMPFLTIDVKSHSIKRDIDAGRNLDSIGLPARESKISIGAGFGFTMFIFDFHVKYNYMKDMPSIGVYAKTKFPVIRF